MSHNNLLPGRPCYQAIPVLVRTWAYQSPHRLTAKTTTMSTERHRQCGLVAISATFVLRTSNLTRAIQALLDSRVAAIPCAPRDGADLIAQFVIACNRRVLNSAVQLGFSGTASPYVWLSHFGRGSLAVMDEPSFSAVSFKSARLFRLGRPPARITRPHTV